MNTKQTITILRHAVESVDDGFSVLQKSLQTDERNVRIASAPTGAGKSYVFQRMMEEGQRILFVVPTIRLSQNLATSMREALLEAGETLDNVYNRVSIWNSMEKDSIKSENDKINIYRHRTKQVRAEHLSKPNAGDIVITTPEAVSSLITAGRKVGAGKKYPFIGDLIQYYDHIVFDEYHTYDPRGLGLVFSIATFSSRLSGHRAKVNLLSATPIEISHLLIEFGVPIEEIAILKENIITGTKADTGNHRAVHGDVQIVYENSTIFDQLKSQINLVQEYLSEGSQVVIIFDSLERLQAEKPKFAALFESINIQISERLVINSADDSSNGDNYFECGWDKNPLDYKILMCTSSVEMGATFKTKIIFMESGQSALSHLQRIGRVSRGDVSGVVYICCGKHDEGKKWLGDVRYSIDTQKLPKCIDVLSFQEFFMTEAKQKLEFKENPEEDNRSFVFKSFPDRAKWCAGLYWNAMRVCIDAKGHRDTLDAFRPEYAKKIFNIIYKLEKSSLRSAKKWAASFREESLTLREIGKKVNVRIPDGRGGYYLKIIPWQMYEAYPAINCCDTFFDDVTGVITVNLDRDLHELLHDRQNVDEYVYSSFPHVGGREKIYFNRNAASNWHWLEKAEKELSSSALNNDQKEVLEIGIYLVKMTGIIPVEHADETAFVTSGKNICF